MAESKYTNVQALTHGATALTGIKSITITESLDLLMSQADGDRAEQIVGELGRITTFTCEFEDEATARNTEIGVAKVGDLVFQAQKDDNTAIKTWTLPNAIFHEWGYGTDQSALNNQSLTGRCQTENDITSVA